MPRERRWKRKSFVIAGKSSLFLISYGGRGLTTSDCFSPPKGATVVGEKRTVFPNHTSNDFFSSLSFGRWGVGKLGCLRMEFSSLSHQPVPRPARVRVKNRLVSRSRSGERRYGHCFQAYFSDMEKRSSDLRPTMMDFPIGGESG